MFFRKLITLSLFSLVLFSFYLFYSNKKLTQNYNLDSTITIRGHFQSYNKEETKRNIYFSFKLKEFSNIFTIPSPEWKSFNFESFISNVTNGDVIILTIPANSNLTDHTIQVLELKSNNISYIDFNKMKKLRNSEAYFALLLGLASIIGVIHHKLSPWV